MPDVIGLMDDLFFQVKVAETAKQLGLDFKVAVSPEPFLDLARSQPKLAIVDLNVRAGGAATVGKLRAAESGTNTRLRVIGFLSHLQRDLAEQAKAAGCDEVMPRSAFTQNLAAILAQARA